LYHAGSLRRELCTRKHTFQTGRAELACGESAVHANGLVQTAWAKAEGAADDNVALGEGG
jgi:hypothetical protein